MITLSYVLMQLAVAIQQGKQWLQNHYLIETRIILTIKIPTK